MREMDAVSCPYCGRYAAQIPELVEEANAQGYSVEKWARMDGTYNPETDHFACDECYVKMGAPSAPGGWRAK